MSHPGPFSLLDEILDSEALGALQEAEDDILLMWRQAKGKIDAEGLS